MSQEDAMKKTYQTIFLIILLITIVLLFSSCATILKGTTEGVDVDSAPTGAKVYINGQYMGKTPLQNKLRSNKTHHIEFVKEGYEKKTVDITSSLGANWIVLDVLFGVFPIIIDAASGSWYNLDDSYARTLLEKKGAKHEARESELSYEPDSESKTSPPFLILELILTNQEPSFLTKFRFCTKFPVLESLPSPSKAYGVLLMTLIKNLNKHHYLSKREKYSLSKLTLRLSTVLKLSKRRPRF